MGPVMEQWGDLLRSEPTLAEATAAGVTVHGRPISHWCLKAIRYWLRADGERPEEPDDLEAVEETEEIQIPDPTEPRRGRVHLVIGDAHARPGESLERFTWLGRLICHIQPDVVISIGDWADMPSLSSYDRGKRSGENRRYSRDITAANEALRLVHREVIRHNKAWGSEPVEPRWVVTLGNHEHRIDRFGNDNPSVDAAEMTDLEFEKWGWEAIPFLEPFMIDGIEYAHYLCKQNNSRPISGDYAPRWLVLSRHASAVVGHSHRLQYHTEVGAGGRRLHGLVCGSYVGGRHEYAKQSNPGWWRGICVLRDVDDGDYDLELWSMERIRERFA